MRKRMFVPCIVVLCALSLFGLSPAHASTALLEGFRGVRWGERSGALPYLKLVEDIGGVRYYKKMNDALHFADVPVSGILYAFYEDRFAAVSISGTGSEHSRRIYEALCGAYGSPSHRSGGGATWELSNNVRVRYRYNKYSHKMQLVCSFGDTADRRLWGRWGQGSD